jgi:hypothetical protein
LFSTLAIVPFVAALVGVGLFVKWWYSRHKGKSFLTKTLNALGDARSDPSPGKVLHSVKRSTGSRDLQGIEFALDRLGQRPNH